MSDTFRGYKPLDLYKKLKRAPYILVNTNTNFRATNLLTDLFDFLLKGRTWRSLLQNSLVRLRSCLETPTVSLTCWFPRPPSRPGFYPICCYKISGNFIFQMRFSLLRPDFFAPNFSSSNLSPGIGLVDGYNLSFGVLELLVVAFSFSFGVLDLLVVGFNFSFGVLELLVVGFNFSFDVLKLFVYLNLSFGVFRWC